LLTRSETRANCRASSQEISELQKALELNKEGLHDQERKARELLVKLDSMQGVEDVCCLRSTKPRQSTVLPNTFVWLSR
jgi:hypothetical protein